MDETFLICPGSFVGELPHALSAKMASWSADKNNNKTPITYVGRCASCDIEFLVRTKSKVADKIIIPKKDIQKELQKLMPESSTECVCPTSVVMFSGCQCGGD